ncbi:hypothetical protein C2G38_2152141 [Gigaspora rosea]|uniref:Uncharacterized protein n=1 Tax=Gigaspora rosea TaxID=44941 RepID=A0A397W925_9GLOM|nr:hypothetical protein C2G38_2152141 [Gigaspora rosea]
METIKMVKETKIQIMKTIKIVKETKFIQVTSTAKAEEGEGFQSFGINAHIKANINEIDNKNILKFSVKLIECGASKMLNKKCQLLEKWFIGFYLESIIIEISPINNNTNNDANSSIISFILKDPYCPQQTEPKNFEASTGYLTSNNVQCNLSSQNIGVNISCSSTNSVSTKETIGE